MGQQIIAAESDGVSRQKLQGKLKVVTPPIGRNNKSITIKKIPQEEIDKLPNHLKTGLTDFCGIAILKVLQSMGFFREVDQAINKEIFFGKFYHGPNINKLLNTLLCILKKRNLIEVKGDLIALSDIGNSLEIIDRLQRIEARSELLVRAFPELSPHIALLKYCIENIPVVLNGEISCDELFQSPALNWIREIFSSSSGVVSRFDGYFKQAITQNFTLFKRNDKLKIVNLGWMENSVSKIADEKQIEEVILLPRKKIEDATFELPNSKQLTANNKTLAAQFDENYFQTDYFQTSSDRKYEIVTFGEGQAIMFLTGLAFSWKIWRYQIPILRKHYRLIFPHFPGHGASVSNSGKFTLEDISDDLKEILNYSQIDSTHLVGWCMGGNIAQLLAARYPEKLKSLVLVGTTPTDARARGVISEDFTNYSANPLETYTIELQNCLRNNLNGDYFIKLYLEFLRDSYCKTNNVYIINYINNLFHFDSRKLLKNINVPTLVISGKWDIAFPTDQVRLLHEQIANSQYIEFDQSGHLPFLTQHDRFNSELLKFLTC